MVGKVLFWREGTYFPSMKSWVYLIGKDFCMGIKGFKKIFLFLLEFWEIYRRKIFTSVFFKIKEKKNS